jgi:hypothetical protein
MNHDCRECGESISTKRLAAKPNAVRCTGCESKYDHILREPGIQMGRLYSTKLPEDAAVVNHRKAVLERRKKAYIPFSDFETQQTLPSPFIVDAGLLATAARMQEGL